MWLSYCDNLLNTYFAQFLTSIVMIIFFPNIMPFFPCVLIFKKEDTREFVDGCELLNCAV